MKDLIEDTSFKMAAWEEQLLVDLLRKHMLQDFRTPDSLYKAGYILQVDTFEDGKKRATLAKIIDSQEYQMKVSFSAAPTQSEATSQEGSDE